MKNILLYILIISAFVSCNNKTNEVVAEDYDKTLLINYYLRTDKSNFVTGETYIYHEKDTLLPNIESVTLQDQTMMHSKINNDKAWRMRIDQEFPKTDEFNFVINHTGYQPIEATFKPEPIKSFNIKEGELSISKGFTVNWDGTRIASQNETMIILLTDANGQSASLNRIGETAGSGFSVDPIQLQYYNFVKGEATIYLIRKTIVELPTNSYYKQKAEIEYYTDEVKINIVD
ncbi:MAG: hypothetical protein AB8G11_07540 [Saprospiraceae bacterium]